MTEGRRAQGWRELPVTSWLGWRPRLPRDDVVVVVGSAQASTVRILPGTHTLDTLYPYTSNLSGRRLCELRFSTL